MLNSSSILVSQVTVYNSLLFRGTGIYSYVDIRLSLSTPLATYIPTTTPPTYIYIADYRTFGTIRHAGTRHAGMSICRTTPNQSGQVSLTTKSWGNIDALPLRDWIVANLNLLYLPT